VSYAVKPDTLVSRDDILFQQGGTSLADAYSYDLIVDLAEAMQSSELQDEQFIVEGHASAEGGYDMNLRLSQERAERIARDLVGMGVDAGRLIPVGYGETEAGYPADAQEKLRALDRRVMVFTAAN
jgi:outer membrane protein OmpA-like peptidoglycan-associated protein